MAALAGATAVACGGTVTAPTDASTPEDSGADATNDVTIGFDGGFTDAPAPQDAFIAQDGFCCPLYGGSPSP